MSNPFKAIEDKLPTRKELSNWSSDKWLDLIRFAELFLEETEGKDGSRGETYRVTKDKIQAAEKFLEIPEHPFHEFLYRISRWSDKSTPREFLYKMTHLFRLSFSYLKRHPANVNQEIEAAIKKHETRLGWILSQYKVEDTAMGAIVERDTKVVEGTMARNESMPSIQANMMTSLLKLSDVYQEIANSISKKDIKRMGIESKIKALNSLSFIFSQATKKVTPNHFTQININSKNVKEVEQSMLDYLKKTN